MFSRVRNAKLSHGNDESVTILTDSLLLQRAAAGDETAFDTLFYRHYDRVYGLLYRLVGSRAEAEDLTQEVFVKLYKQFMRKRPFSSNPPPHKHNISGWLYRVATNLGYNAIRGRTRRWQRDTVLVPDPQGTPGAEHEVEGRERAAAVRAALSQMPQRDVQLLLLRQTGLSYAECAAACEVAPGSVGTLLRRAAENFREAYQTISGEQPPAADR